ncbi:glycosyltransferase [Bacteroides graminisolvens]|uniref:glycosyltransferase n=1 Tax=Bacteroides graminisolvens TaxID=477666 RepID=UPI0023F3EAD7|nr:glycosyltransferase [Bacteroides graminisolvens]
MRVLIVSKVHTHPTTMGNSFAILAQAEVLKRLGCDVQFLYIQERGLKASAQQYDDILLKMKGYWGDKLHVLQTPKYVRLFENIRNIFFKKCRDNHTNLYNMYVDAITPKVKALQQEYHFDACLVQYIYMTKLYDHVDFHKKAIFTHDVLAYKNLIVGENVQWYDAAQEARALQKCTDVFAIQEEEMHYFKVLSPRSRHYNVLTPYKYHPQPIAGNKNIVFLSGNNAFNQNGLRWFIENVFPLIRQKHEDAKLLIAGGICKVIKGLYDNIEGIVLKGFVGDPREFFALGDVAINPTYQGTGLKIKTFESIANDKVTLVHPHSMVGIYDKQNAPLFSSDKPQEWADYLDSIWGPPERIAEIKKHNKAYIHSLNDFIEGEYKRFLEA